MRHILTIRPFSVGALRGVALAVLVMGAWAFPPNLVQAEDPVEQLRQALPLRLDELGNPSPATLKYRQETLQKRVDALRKIGELRRALALEEWRENPNQVVNKAIR